MKNIKGIIFIVILVGVIAFAVKGIAPILPQAVKPVFKPAPEFELKDIAGNTKRLSDFKGKVVILDFWATWCPPCKMEIPHFIELYDKYKDKGLEVVGVALDWNGQRVIPSFVKDNRINYTVLFGNNEVSERYGGIQAIPTTFIVDRDGGIRNKYVGYRDKETFEKAIEGLL